jgi:DUF1365 family protein
MSFASALYPGIVTHHRQRPRQHNLRYRVSPVLLDIDELPALGRQLKLFAHNRAGLFSFHDRDHGDGDGDIRAWAGARLAEAGIDIGGGQITLLCYPRMLGYVFNPLSVYFCRKPDGRLAAVLYEVHNTLGERHTYVLPVEGEGTIRQTIAKQFYVSPFIPMDCIYRFRLSPPGKSVALSIAESDAEGPLLSAVFAGSRRALTDGALLRTFLLFPLMTLKIIAGIHYEAVKLWLKRTPVFPYSRARQPHGVTIAAPPQPAE